MKEKWVLVGMITLAALWVAGVTFCVSRAMAAGMPLYEGQLWIVGAIFAPTIIVLGIGYLLYYLFVRE